ncbi:MAG: plasmid mobilization protein, partial [Syntrophales bacterium]
DVDRIKKELKVARRVATMESNRIDPLLTERVAVRLSKDEYERLKRQAEEKGVSVSDRMRDIIRKTIV